MARSVLVVDDNPFIRRTLCELFTREADFEICGEAENGREAIGKAQEFRPDLIVLDLSMPVMNGIDAARTLKRLMPTVPIIMFSEYSDAFSLVEAHSIGVSALVSKSEHVSALVGKARALFNDIAA
jgi:two-component system, chemotaxis family, chemotaxis protein CheY